MIELPPLVAELCATLPPTPRFWLVGGAVRDLVLRRRVHDYDFVVAGDGVAVGRAAAQHLQADFYPLDAERGVGRVLLTRDDERLTLDFASLRGGSPEVILAARDFHLRPLAMAPAAAEQVIEPITGQADLRNTVLRECRPTSLSDDPVRTIRAVRLAVQLGFRLDHVTRAAVRAAAPALAQVTAERQRDEFLRCLGGGKPAAALRTLAALGLLSTLLPELPAAGPAWDHTLTTVDRLTDILSVLNPVHDVDAASDLTLGLVSLRLGRHRTALGPHLKAALTDERPVRWLLVLAAVLRGTGATRDRLTAMRLSTDEVRRVLAIVGGAPELARQAGDLPVSRRAVYRYFRAFGPAGVESVFVALADFLAGHVGPPPAAAWNEQLDAASALLRGYFETPEEVVNPPALLTGDDLMGELDLRPGPKVGALLEAVREAQAAGEVADREAALALARQQLARH